MRQFEETLRHDFPASTGPAAVLIESIQGVGGTMQFTKGFLQRAFEAVQKRGGLAISDEVQTGFGRLGSHFWGFETQDAKPDIVTMAKGIGNGFPLGAVVTTEEIAASFGKALYFNTFGGNPMASVVGKTVLEELPLQTVCKRISEWSSERRVFRDVNEPHWIAIKETSDTPIMIRNRDYWVLSSEQ
ncbi:aminotransferase, class III [Cooperia oncophora]